MFRPKAKKSKQKNWKPKNMPKRKKIVKSEYGGIANVKFFRCGRFKHPQNSILDILPRSRKASTTPRQKKV